MGSTLPTLQIGSSLFVFFLSTVVHARCLCRVSSIVIVKSGSFSSMFRRGLLRFSLEGYAWCNHERTNERAHHNCELWNNCMHMANDGSTNMKDKRSLPQWNLQNVYVKIDNGQDWMCSLIDWRSWPHHPWSTSNSSGCLSLQNKPNRNDVIIQSKCIWHCGLFPSY